ncbi:phage holin family protein [candidate division WWE3 bacterium]|uniref:Phage holin family protein n=1 Tax=candidate division WWE3 bacterium TaxID=2053526 RepID=A0A955LKS9_UNCKA|nr:phage holin family protein [candidate division WWE3 bacterium]
MKLILRWIINALSLMVVANVLSGFLVESFYIAMIAALILGILNAVVRPILVLLTLPINIFTLGLFSFVINAGIIFFVGTFVAGFSIDFTSALIASVLLWLIGIVSNLFLKD